MSGWRFRLRALRCLWIAQGAHQNNEKSTANASVGDHTWSGWPCQNMAGIAPHSNKLAQMITIQDRSMTGRRSAEFTIASETKNHNASAIAEQKISPGK